MSRARSSSRAFAVFVGAVAVLFLAEQFGRTTPLFRDVLTRSRLGLLASVAKLAPQLLGSVFGARCAARYAKENPARRAWILMSAWLGCWSAGQLVLSSYDPVLGVPAPVPSLGDLFFAAGYAWVILALFAFVTAYRRSGFAPGSARQDALIALGACAVFGLLGYVVLLPIAVAPTPIGERIVNVGYPLLDFGDLHPRAGALAHHDQLPRWARVASMGGPPGGDPLRDRGRRRLRRSHAGARRRDRPAGGPAVHPRLLVLRLRLAASVRAGRGLTKRRMRGCSRGGVRRADLRATTPGRRRSPAP